MVYKLALIGDIQFFLLRGGLSGLSTFHVRQNDLWVLAVRLIYSVMHAVSSGPQNSPRAIILRAEGRVLWASILIHAIKSTLVDLYVGAWTSFVIYKL